MVAEKKIVEGTVQYPFTSPDTVKVKGKDVSLSLSGTDSLVHEYDDNKTWYAGMRSDHKTVPDGSVIHVEASANNEITITCSEEDSQYLFFGE